MLRPYSVLRRDGEYRTKLRKIWPSSVFSSLKFERLLLSFDEQDRVVVVRRFLPSGLYRVELDITVYCWLVISRSVRRLHVEPFHLS